MAYFTETVVPGPFVVETTYDAGVQVVVLTKNPVGEVVVVGPQGPQGDPGSGGTGGGSVPDGGTTNQVLAKRSATNGDATWKTLTFSDVNAEPAVTGGSTTQFYRGDKTWQTLDKNAVGLGNANNTSDAAKPLSTAAVTALAAKADLVSGVVPSSQMPAIALTEFLGTVASQTAMLALVGQIGDWCIRTDTGNAWFVTGATTSVIGNWTAIPTPAAAIQSVNGQTGIVVLGKSNVGLGSADNTSDANKPVSGPQQTALDGKADLNHGHAATEITSGMMNIERSTPGQPIYVIKALAGFGAAAGSWPASRPTSRTDIHIICIGDTDPGVWTLDNDEWILVS